MGTIRVDYHVIKSPTGKSWGVWWSESELEAASGEWVWCDGGHVSTHRTREKAEAEAASRNAEMEICRFSASFLHPHKGTQP